MTVTKLNVANSLRNLADGWLQYRNVVDSFFFAGLLESNVGSDAGRCPFVFFRGTIKEGCISLDETILEVQVFAKE